MPKDLVFIDTETSGLDPENPCHELLEIAAVRLDPMTMVESLRVHLYVKPVFIVDPEAAAINGYNEEKWAKAGAVYVDEALPFLFDILHCATPAGQNIEFDLAFLSREYRRSKLYQPKMNYHRVDLMSLAYPLVVAGRIPGVSLKYQTKFFGFGEQRHTAMEDVEHEIAVFRRLMTTYVNSWRDTNKLWPYEPDCSACCGTGRAQPPKVGK